MTPTARSLTLLGELGYESMDVVEWRDRFGHTHDLLGVIDILAFRGDQTLGVQTTSATNVAHRLVKINASPKLNVIANAGWRLVVHGWRADGRLREVVVLPGRNCAGWPEQMTLPLGGS